MAYHAKGFRGFSCSGEDRLEDEELLTVEEVARRLKVNQKRVYKLIQSGELEATDIGGEGRNIYRISLADFNRYLQSRKVRRDDRH